MVVIVLLGVPTMLWIVEIGMGYLGLRFQRRTHAAALGAMVALFAWQATGRPESVLAGTLVIGMAWLASTWGYLRISFARALAGALSVATPVVLIVFVASSPVRFEVLQPNSQGGDVKRIESDTPVVMMVFDEWPLASITSSASRIDGRLFPGIAELARDSTWFPNALAAARMTREALPGIVTGSTPQGPGEETPPSEAAFPVNLCTIFRSGGFRVTAQEQYSNFCGGKFSREVRVTALLRRGTTPNVLPVEGASTLIDSIAGGRPNPASGSGVASA